MSTNAETKPAAKRLRKMAREPNRGVTDQTRPKRQSKAEQVLQMLQSPEGATIE